jgi:hypothetical protein
MRLYLLVCVLCGCFLRRVFLRLLLSGAGAGPPFALAVMAELLVAFWPLSSWRRSWLSPLLVLE